MLHGVVVVVHYRCMSMSMRCSLSRDFFWVYSTRFVGGPGHVWRW